MVPSKWSRSSTTEMDKLRWMLNANYQHQVIWRWTNLDTLEFEGCLRSIGCFFHIIKPWNHETILLHQPHIQGLTLGIALLLSQSIICSTFGPLDFLAYIISNPDSHTIFICLQCTRLYKSLIQLFLDISKQCRQSPLPPMLTNSGYGTFHY